MDCTSANYGTDAVQHHIGLHQIPLSAATTTERSRTVLNRIVLVAKGETQMPKHFNYGFDHMKKYMWLHA